jgi:CO/xanthine dehydrogenase Mo-binding subunit
MMWPVTDEVRIPDRWPLSPDVARFAGDGVAVVLARTPAAAKDAAEAVLVEYDPIPAVTDMGIARRRPPGPSPLRHEPVLPLRAIDRRHRGGVAGLGRRSPREIRPRSIGELG